MRKLQFTAAGVPPGWSVLLTSPSGEVLADLVPPASVRLSAPADARNMRLEVRRGGGPPVERRGADSCRLVSNPFQESAGLLFDLAEGGPIEAGIFDVAGRMLRRLERAKAEAGENVLVWDGRDAGGREVPAGVYLARYRMHESSGMLRLVRVK